MWSLACCSGEVVQWAHGVVPGCQRGQVIMMALMTRCPFKVMKETGGALCVAEEATERELAPGYKTVPNIKRRLWSKIKPKPWQLYTVWVRSFHSVIESWCEWGMLHRVKKHSLKNSPFAKVYIWFCLKQSFLSSFHCVHLGLKVLKKFKFITDWWKNWKEKISSHPPCSL